MQILKATTSQLCVIQQLAHKIWPSTFKDILSEKQINYMLNQMYNINKLMDDVQKEGVVYLLVHDNLIGEFVGFAAFETNYQNKAKTKLHKLYVLPGCQRKGIGAALINKVQEMAMEYNNFTLSLNVNRNNSAKNFYKKNGFCIVKEENIDIGNGYWMEDYVMEKFLN